MTTSELIFDLLKIILPSSLLLLGMYYLVKNYVDRDYKLRLLEQTNKDNEEKLKASRQKDS